LVTNVVKSGMPYVPSFNTLKHLGTHGAASVLSVETQEGTGADVFLVVSNCFAKRIPEVGDRSIGLNAADSENDGTRGPAHYRFA
jgi:hypothetical protein